MEFLEEYHKSLIVDTMIRRLQEFSSFKEKCLRAIPNNGLKNEYYLEFEYILGDASPSKLIASNCAVRCELMKLFIAAAMSHYEKATEEPHGHESIKFYLVTIIDDDWTTGDLRPKINLPNMQKKARSSLKHIFDGYVGMTEFQAFTNVRHDDGGRQISGHHHILGWSKETLGKDLIQRLKRKFWVKDLYQGDYRSLESVKIQKIQPKLEDIARVASYMLKAPNKCKTLYRNKNGTHINLHESETGDRYVLYMRMAEILSYFKIDRLMFAGGEGSSVRRSIVRDLKQKISEKQGSNIQEDYSTFWRVFRKRTRTNRFKKPKVIV